MERAREHRLTRPNGQQAARPLRKTLAFRQVVHARVIPSSRAVFRGSGGFDNNGGLPVSTFDLDRLLRNRRGNVSMMYALVAPILVFGGGAALDYGRAAQIHTKLNAAADAAALAALTPAMLLQSSSVAQTAAENLFNGLTENI